jgi:hypothetical protein
VRRPFSISVSSPRIFAVISTAVQSRLNQPYAIINGYSLRVSEFILCEAPYILKRCQKLGPAVG